MTRTAIWTTGDLSGLEHLSASEIANRWGCSAHTVWLLRRQLRSFEAISTPTQIITDPERFRPLVAEFLVAVMDDSRISERMAAAALMNRTRAKEEQYALTGVWPS